MRKAICQLFALCLALTAAAFTMAAEGLVTVPSPHDPVQTLDRLESLVSERGLSVFARIDHAAGARSIGSELRPTAVLIFGNPQGGTPFMICEQTVGIDLPLKMLVWEDEEGQVWLSYNQPEYLAARHTAEDCAAVAQMTAALKGIAEAVTAAE